MSKNTKGLMSQEAALEVIESNLVSGTDEVMSFVFPAKTQNQQVVRDAWNSYESPKDQDPETKRETA